LIELQVNERHRNETYFPIQCTGAFFFRFGQWISSISKQVESDVLYLNFRHSSSCIYK
jgi:hypothetical protein